MTNWATDQTDRYVRMEAEANEFSALLLIPPPALRLFIPKGDPSLEHVPLIAKHFDVSKEAAARAYARYHPSEIAIVVIKDSIVKRVHKRNSFPWIAAPYGRPVPKDSLFYGKDLKERVASAIAQTVPDNWIDVQRGQRAPDLYEQVYLQQNGYALLLLWLEKEEAEEVDDERTSKQRFQDRARWR